MTTSSSSVLRLRVLAHFFVVVSLFLALLANAIDPLGIVYEVAGAGSRLVRREGTLGGPTPAITETGDSERPYAVDGNTFTDYTSAAQRSCNLQYDSCQLAANTDESVSFTLEDCQDQQNDCIADPPAVSDGSSTASVASSDDTSDSTDSSDSSSDDADTGTAESNENSSESSAASDTASTASTADTEDTSQSTSDDDSETSDTDTADSAEAESEAADSVSTTASTTQAKPVLVTQTTIPYDAEFDLVCDL